MQAGRSEAKHRLSERAISSFYSSSDMAVPEELSGLSDEAAYAACSEPDASTKVG